jgi:hypothetical protein
VSSAASLLELSRYLEHYLWPAYDAESAQQQPTAMTMSIIAMINAKFSENVVGAFGESFLCFYLAAYSLFFFFGSVAFCLVSIIFFFCRGAYLSFVLSIIYYHCINYL